MESSPTFSSLWLGLTECWIERFHGPGFSRDGREFTLGAIEVLPGAPKGELKNSSRKDFWRPAVLIFGQRFIFFPINRG